MIRVLSSLAIAGVLSAGLVTLSGCEKDRDVKYTRTTDGSGDREVTVEKKVERDGDYKVEKKVESDHGDYKYQKKVDTDDGKMKIERKVETPNGESKIETKTDEHGNFKTEVKTDD